MSISRGGKQAATLANKYEWLWVDDAGAVTRWFLGQNRDYKRFYGAFLNYANRVVNIAHDKNALEARKGLSNMEEAVFKCLQLDPIPSDDLITILGRWATHTYPENYRESGLVPMHNGERPGERALENGKNRLRERVHAHEARKVRDANKRANKNQSANKNRAHRASVAAFYNKKADTKEHGAMSGLRADLSAVLDEVAAEPAGGQMLAPAAQQQQHQQQQQQPVSLVIRGAEQSPALPAGELLPSSAPQQQSQDGMQDAE